MKSIFLDNNKEVIGTVYSEVLQNFLAEDAGLDLTVWTKDDTLNTPEKFADTEYVFSTWGMPAYTEEEIKSVFPSLKAVFYAAGSVQGFALPFIRCGIKVFSAWAANAVPVAEYTTAQIVLSLKGFWLGARYASKGEYSSARKYPYPGCYEQKIGIIGAGMIGKLVIDMLKRYRLDVMVFDPFLPDSKAKELGVTKCSLEDIFSQCMVITNHLANNAETRGMLNYSLFEKMRPCSTFINTGRGAQVVERELIRILEEREDVTALLDVTWPEPPEAGSPFFALENCILTPHIAGSLGEEVKRMAEYMKEEYLLFTQGKNVRYSVSEEMLATMA